MNAKLKVAVIMLAGIGLGAAATEGLHAQAKKKAYVVSEIQLIDAKAQADYIPAIRKAMAEHHGHALETLGKVTSIEGPDGPQLVGISQWDSVDDAVAFYKSKVYDDLSPLRDKSTKVLRRYVAEVEK